MTASKPRQKDDDGDVGVGVVPILDSTLGTVSLRVDGRWHHYLAEGPRALTDALANAVGRPRFDPRSGTLTVRTAATGSRTVRRPPWPSWTCPSAPDGPPRVYS